MRFQTLAIHSGQTPDPNTGSIIPAIYQNVTFEMDAPGVHRGFDYTRTVNPTRAALERCLADLEGGRFCTVFSSGMAATAAATSMLRSGDHVVASHHIYAGTHRFLSSILSRSGVTTTFADTEDSEEVLKALTPSTRMIWVETPGNPLVTISDVALVCAQVREKLPEALVVVDSTLASPYCQRPLYLGADVVLHSTTKYISGHLDVLGGALITSDETLHKTFFDFQNATGPTPGPFDNWLTLRGVRTLGVRMKAHQENAQAVAEMLQSHPLVQWVSYPGLESHPQHDVACRQMTGFSGMVAACIGGGAEAVAAFASNLKLFKLAESLGGVESLLSHSATMTHAPLTPEQQEAMGIVGGLVRLSVGIEDTADLLEDLSQALDKV